MTKKIKTQLHKSSKAFNFLLPMLLSIPISGCDGQLPDESALGTANNEVLGVNALGVNALGVNALGVNALGVNALGVNALGVNALGVNSLASTGLSWLHASPTYSSQNYDRAQLLKYLVKCALPSGQYLAAHAGHSGCVGYPQLDGMYGLAPGWLSSSSGMSDLYEQRWVTACVLAHVNEHGTPQTISLHGAHSAFASVAAERATMYASEGKYWGNIFRPESWKHTCYNNGRTGGNNSQSTMDVILGRSCPDTGCGVMTANGHCETTVGSYTGLNNWVQYNYQYQMTGYSTYGYVYQENSLGSRTPNSNYYFPTVEALSPVSLDFEGSSGTMGLFPHGCYGDSAYNDGISSVAYSDISMGTGTPWYADCSRAFPCAGGYPQNGTSTYGAKLRGIPTGTRLRYSFLTAQPVTGMPFRLKVRYSAATAAGNVKARFRLNGSPIPASTSGLYTFIPTQDWDTYSTFYIVSYFTNTPAGLQNISCGYGRNGRTSEITSYNVPYAITFEVEAEPGAPFPDLDTVWLEPWT